MNAPKQKKFSELLDEIESRANAAAPIQSWHPENWDSYTLAWFKTKSGKRDLDFIAAARSDVPALVKALRELWTAYSDTEQCKRDNGLREFAEHRIAQLLREPADSKTDL